MLLIIASLFAIAPIQYPEAHRGNVVDTLHGVEVADPYRWLEQDVRESNDVRDWVQDENTITRQYLDSIEVLPYIKETLTKAWNYEKHGLPFHRGIRWFQSRNTGLQNHSVIYTGNSPTTIEKVVLDPNLFSEDGTQALSMYSPSPEGNYLVWGISNAGSDWSTWYAKDLNSGELLPEVIRDIKNDSPSWLPDESGYYYSRYPDSNNENHIETTDSTELWFHTMNTPQSDDKLVWSDTDHPNRFYNASVTKDGGWLVISVNIGTSSNNAVLVKGPNEKELHWLISDFDAEVSLIGGMSNTLWFKTDRDAPNGKLISVHFDSETPKWSVVVPEQQNILRSADIVGGKITCSWLEDASSKTTVHSLLGNLLYEVKLPGIGTASGFNGDAKDKTVYWSYSSYNQPPSIYSLDLEDGATTLCWESDVPIDLSSIVVRRDL